MKKESFPSVQTCSAQNVRKEKICFTQLDALMLYFTDKLGSRKRQTYILEESTKSSMDLLRAYQQPAHAEPAGKEMDNSLEITENHWYTKRVVYHF